MRDESVIGRPFLLLKRFSPKSGKQHQATQWVEQDHKTLGPGDTAHIPVDLVHGTYNNGDQPLVFLAILSPAKFEGPLLVDMSGEKPWCGLTSAP